MSTGVMSINYDELFNDFISKTNITRVEDRNYWLVRTNGGNNYQDFALHDYIAIGWDYITLNALNTKTHEELRKIIEIQSKNKTNRYADDELDDSDDDEGDIVIKSDSSDESTSKMPTGTITGIINKLDGFVNSIKIDDIVLIPSKSYQKISIGIVRGNVYEDPDYVEYSFSRYH